MFFLHDGTPAEIYKEETGGSDRCKKETAAAAANRHELGTKIGLRIPLQRLHIFPASEAGTIAA